MPNDAWHLTAAQQSATTLYSLTCGLNGGPPTCGAPMVTSYQASPSPARLGRQEVNVFARDPAEYTNTMFGLLADDSAFQAQVAPCALPNAMALRYPTSTGGPAQNSLTVLEDFFPFGPDCLGRIPTSLTNANGNPSIQSAIMNDHGLCGAAIGGKGVLTQLQQAIWTSFYQGVAATGQNCADAVQVYFDGSEYLCENPHLTPDISPTGGFDINFALGVPLALCAPNSVPPQGCQPPAAVAFNFSYAWGLHDGVLTATPTEQAAYDNGSDQPLATGVRKDTECALGNTASCTEGKAPAVQPGIEGAAKLLQVAGLLKSTCTPLLNAPINPVPIAGNTDFNAGIQNEINFVKGIIGQNYVQPGQGAAHDGTFQALGLDDGTTNLAGLHPSDILRAAVDEPDPASPVNYHNWVCALNCPGNETPVFQSPGMCSGGDIGQYRYMFVPRAKRLNSYPDGVELIWTDDLPNEVGPLTSVTTTTSGVSLYVTVYDLASHSSGGLAGEGPFAAGLRKLCNDIPSSSARTYAVLSVGELINHSSDPTKCLVGMLSGFLPWNASGTTREVEFFIFQALLVLPVFLF